MLAWNKQLAITRFYVTLGMRIKKNFTVKLGFIDVMMLGGVGERGTIQWENFILEAKVFLS